MRKKYRLLGGITTILALAIQATMAATCLQVDQGGRTFMGSTFVHGFQVLVFDDKFAGWTTSSTELSYAIVTTNGAKDVWLRNQPQYAYEVSLFGTNGVQVPKTEMGKIAGSKFSELDPTNLHTGMKLQHLIADKPEQGLDSCHLFKIKDLFKITNPGNYVLRIRFQFLERVRIGTNDVFRVVRFPPMDCPVRDKQPSK